MKRRLSALSTPVYKFMLPTLWLVASLAMVPLLMSYGPYLALWSLLLLAPAALMAYFFAPLKYVAVDDAFLYVSNYRQEIRVPFGEILEVRERRGRRNTVGEIILCLKSPTRFGQEIRFVPRMVLWPSTAAYAEATSRSETDPDGAARVLWASFSVAEDLRQRVDRAGAAKRPNGELRDTEEAPE